MVERKDTLAVAERKARPILFSGEMVRALMAGSKTQTRRAIKPQPSGRLLGILPRDKGPRYWFAAGPADQTSMEVYCPYGQPGDLLWVRETWAPDAIARGRFNYRADYLGHFADTPPGNKVDGGPKKWTPSIYMPRRASRLTLYLTEVRVERLQDISEEDAQAEGALHNAATLEEILEAGGTRDDVYDSARQAYEELWNGINGEGSWEANPFVWCIGFNVMRQNVDEVLNPI